MRSGLPCRAILALNNISRIDDEIAKLRQAVSDGRYDERSLVGDAVLRIETQLAQARQHLTPCSDAEKQRLRTASNKKPAP